jgi:hypothetical protein
MQFFILQARPVDPHEEDADITGAFVSCWVDFKDLAGCRVLAEHFLREQGWEPGEFGDAREVTREDYLDDPLLLDAYDEAVRDGMAFAIYTWTDNDDADANDAPAAGGTH